MICGKAYEKVLASAETPASVWLTVMFPMVRNEPGRGPFVTVMRWVWFDEAPLMLHAIPDPDFSVLAVKYWALWLSSAQL